MNALNIATIAVIAAVAVMNLACFALMGHDKQCAKRKQRRIPEKTLFLAAILFGAFGGTLGMYVFRHKTKHWYFKVSFPLLMILQAGILGYLWSSGILGG